MEKEQLIRKWLDNELTESELQAFKNLEEFDQYTRISDTIKHLEIPTYHVDEQLEALHARINTKKSKVISLKPFLRIAAVLVLFVGVYYAVSLRSTSTNHYTQIAQKETITLPDNSTVMLNAMSSISYDEDTWEAQRNVSLEGEAYFKVAKGTTFNVQTTNGTVTVLGTQFNIKNRDEYFDVVCYEGSVKVTTAAQEVILKAGDRFRESVLITGTTITSIPKSPFWTHNESSFKKSPLKEVIAELERQYQVQVDVDEVFAQELYTGTFTHDNIDIALKSISLPFNLTYTKEENKVTLARD
ncbi:FecR domain-containing protein [uncultured Dokdonia sp.]|uniref:FecR family protein n=1 Tax=uncultured Dokdonia sp. TaxID=575653 RepID=UPI0030EF241D|tara:strand:- start:107934 stop:108833 length:900 start_codon:yes stop_codon:yes gene_type:complete